MQAINQNGPVRLGGPGCECCRKRLEEFQQSQAEVMFRIIEEKRKELDELSRLAVEKKTSEQRAKPISERIVNSAHARCPCGAGLAYDPVAEDETNVFKGPGSGYWDCSAIILGTQDNSVKHTAKLPFAFYDVKSEGQPSACGATTRPKTIEYNHDLGNPVG